MRTAALNAEGLRKQYMISRADLLPGINATGSGSRGRTAKDLSSTGNSYVSSAYNVGLGVTSYELDLFGKVRSNTQAALQTYFSSLAARDSAHLSLIASVAKAYFNELYAQDSMKLAQKRVEIARADFQTDAVETQGGCYFRRRSEPAVRH